MCYLTAQVQGKREVKERQTGGGPATLNRRGQYVEKNPRRTNQWEASMESDNISRRDLRLTVCTTVRYGSAYYRRQMSAFVCKQLGIFRKQE